MSLLTMNHICFFVSAIVLVNVNFSFSLPYQAANPTPTADKLVEDSEPTSVNSVSKDKTLCLTPGCIKAGNSLGLDWLFFSATLNSFLFLIFSF